MCSVSSVCRRIPRCISGLQACRILGRAHTDSTLDVYNWTLHSGLSWRFLHLHPNGIDNNVYNEAIQDSILLFSHCTIGRVFFSLLTVPQKKTILLNTPCTTRRVFCLLYKREHFHWIKNCKCNNNVKTCLSQEPEPGRLDKLGPFFVI